MTKIEQHIAIFGCGQLAQMTAQAGIPLGLRFSFIADEGEDSRCVDPLGNVVSLRADISAKALYDELGQPDVITVEKEMVDTALLDQLQQFTRVYPGGNAIHIAQNRIREKNFLQSLGIPTADFEIITDTKQLATLPERLGYPIYIKAAESGYDGYNQWRIQTENDLSQAELIAAVDNGIELIAEKHVNYSREVSVIAARTSVGELTAYPMMENRHEEGVLIATVAPAPDLALEPSALKMIEALLVKMEYIGVLTMECFETEQGIVVNELAPRVHNSGHWTIEGADTSQFENHCRAIAGMPLGSTAVSGVAGLVNMLGEHGDKTDIKAIDPGNVFYHAYGKEERPRRKLGHVTIREQAVESLKGKLNQVMTALYAKKYPPL